MTVKSTALFIPSGTPGKILYSFQFASKRRRISLPETCYPSHNEYLPDTAMNPNFAETAYKDGVINFTVAVPVLVSYSLKLISLSPNSVAGCGVPHSSEVCDEAVSESQHCM